ncbi:MAG: hypothetical protein ACREBS_08385 [Nitrososphaerales archaeon]
MEKHMTVAWADLTTLRITCKSCSTVFEVDMAKMESKLVDSTACPVCKSSWLLALGQGNHENMLMKLVFLHRGLAKTSNQFDVEFVVPVKE